MAPKQTMAMAVVDRVGLQGCSGEKFGAATGRCLMNAWWEEALTEQPAAHRRLLDAAEHCHANAGPEGITMAAVASEAGVSRRTLYRYFSDRASLFDGVRARAWGRVLADVRIATTTRDHPIQQVLDFLLACEATGRCRLLDDGYADPIGDAMTVGDPPLMVLGTQLVDVVQPVIEDAGACEMLRSVDRAEVSSYLRDLAVTAIAYPLVDDLAINLRRRQYAHMVIPSMFTAMPARAPAAS